MASFVPIMSKLVERKFHPRFKLWRRARFTESEPAREYLMRYDIGYPLNYIANPERRFEASR